MNRLGRSLLIGLSGAALAAVIGPLVVPIPPLEDTLPVEDLADPESRFVDVQGVRVHYKIKGQGTPVMVLLHGFGASLFSWHAVMESLGELGTVIAFDRPGFGLSARPLDRGGKSENPYSPEFQSEIVMALLDMVGAHEAVLVGNSAGGTVAVQTALRHPERVRGLVLADPAVYVGGGAPGWVRPVLATPQMRRLGPFLLRGLMGRGQRLINLAWHDTGKVTPEILEGYSKPLRAENWDRALWEFTIASRPSRLAERLHELKVPTLVITGDADRIVPTAQSVRLASELPNGSLKVIEACGHLPQEECPDEFMRAVTPFIKGLA